MEHKKWQKVKEFCEQSWNFNNFVPELYRICALFTDVNKFSIDLGSPYFATFSAKCWECVL